MGTVVLAFLFLMAPLEIPAHEVIEVDATAYTYECGFPWADGWTATMTRATEGRTIAVDPSVVPLGSRVYVVGLGWRKAEDTGGVIRGNIIDIYMGRGPDARQRAIQFGRQRMTIILWKECFDDKNEQ